MVAVRARVVAGMGRVGAAKGELEKGKVGVRAAPLFRQA